MQNSFSYAGLQRYVFRISKNAYFAEAMLRTSSFLQVLAGFLAEFVIWWRRCLVTKFYYMCEYLETLKQAIILPVNENVTG